MVPQPNMVPYPSPTYQFITPPPFDPRINTSTYYNYIQTYKSSPPMDHSLPHSSIQYQGHFQLSHRGESSQTSSCLYEETTQNKNTPTNQLSRPISRQTIQPTNPTLCTLPQTNQQTY